MVLLEFQVRMLIYLLTLFLAFMGSFESLTERSPNQAAQEYEKYRREDGLVTLLPPYTEWKWNKNDPLARLSVRSAVRAVCLQAGIYYEGSELNTDVDIMAYQYITPKIKDMRPEDALDEILTPVNLRYEIVDNCITLQRVDDGLESAQRLVTLKPPYTTSKALDTQGAQISLQYAVIHIGEQAGLDYDFEKSLENTRPLCQMSIHPEIDNMPFADAMEEILQPKGLTYVIERNTIILVKKETNQGDSYSPDAWRPESRIGAGFRMRQVSLKPPFTGWNPDKRDREDEIAVRAAVGAICRQAGIAFDGEGSYDNTNPMCERRISPSIDRETWEAAMEEILAPGGLDYEVENGKVVLVR